MTLNGHYRQVAVIYRWSLGQVDFNKSIAQILDQRNTCLDEPAIIVLDSLYRLSFVPELIITPEPLNIYSECRGSHKLTRYEVQRRIWAKQWIFLNYSYILHLRHAAKYEYNAGVAWQFWWPVGLQITCLFIRHIILPSTMPASSTVERRLSTIAQTNRAVCIACLWFSVCKPVISMSNVILVDEKFTSFHEDLRYSHKCCIVVFSIPSAIL